MRGWLKTTNDWYEFGLANKLTDEQARRFADDMFKTYEGAGPSFAQKALWSWIKRDSQPAQNWA